MRHGTYVVVGIVVLGVVLCGGSGCLDMMGNPWETEPQKQNQGVTLSMDDEGVVLEGVGKIKQEVPSSRELEGEAVVEVPEGTTATTEVPMRIRYKFKKEEPDELSDPTSAAPALAPASTSMLRQRQKPSRGSPDSTPQAARVSTEHNYYVVNSNNRKIIVVSTSSPRGDYCSSRGFRRSVNYSAPDQALDRFFDGHWSQIMHRRQSRDSRGWGRSDPDIDRFFNRGSFRGSGGFN